MAGLSVSAEFFRPPTGGKSVGGPGKTGTNGRKRTRAASLAGARLVRATALVIPPNLAPESALAFHAPGQEHFQQRPERVAAMRRRPEILDHGTRRRELDRSLTTSRRF